MNQKEDHRPGKGGNNKGVIQRVYIGFVCIKCFGVGA